LLLCRRTEKERKKRNYFCCGEERERERKKNVFFLSDIDTSIEWAFHFGAEEEHQRKEKGRETTPNQTRQKTVKRSCLTID
jgi:hypothetical protein